MLKDVCYIIILTLLFYFTYNYYLNIENLEGKWITLKKYKDFSLDISDNSTIKYPYFSKINFYSYTSPFISLNEDEQIYMNFNNVENTYHQVFLCDDGGKLLRTFEQPKSLLFTTKGKCNSIILEEKVVYSIFLRINNVSDNVTNKLVKNFSSSLTNSTIYERKNNIIIDENYFYDNKYKELDILIKKIQRTNMIVKVLHSESYTSFPVNLYAHKITFSVEKGEKIMIITTTKNINYGITHIIEVNSEINSLNWFPEKENKLILNNSEDDNLFTIYERLYGVDEGGSNILPFSVIVYK